MKQELRKKDRLRLAPEDYRRLQRQVLERDGWRCQWCGALEQLEVHHQRLRSHLGKDSEDNLITLCASCHRKVHD